MKPSIALCLTLLAALTLGACHTVTSKTLVGGNPAPLDPKIWNAKWRNADGSAIATRIKDANLGIIEVKTFEPWTKPQPGEQATAEVHLRTLGAGLVANEQIAPHAYAFERVSATENSIVTFAADGQAFTPLIKQGRIKGVIEHDKKGKPTGDCTIEGLSDRDYQRLKKEGVDVATLFKQDPDKVFTRGHGLW